MTRQQLAPALAACGLDPQTPYRMLTSDSDTLVVALEAEPDRLIAKIATSTASSRGLGQHVDSVADLRSLLDGLPSADLLPRVVRDGRLAGNRVVIETQLPGHAATPRLAGARDSTAAAGGADRHPPGHHGSPRPSTTRS